MTEEKTTLCVSKDVAGRLKEKAAEAKLSMYHFANLVLDWALKNMRISIQREYWKTKDADDGPESPPE